MEMHSVFTDHVRNNDGSTQEFQKVADKLRPYLINQLKRRGVWQFGPTIIGLDHNDWNKDALDDLVSQCYASVFIGMSEKNSGGKWVYWERRVTNGESIEGLIYQSVTNYLYDQQKKHTPFAIKTAYKFLKKAVIELVEEGELVVLEGNEADFSLDWEVMGSAETSESKTAKIEEIEYAIKREGVWQNAVDSLSDENSHKLAPVKESIETLKQVGIVRFRVGDVYQAICGLVSIKKEIVHEDAELIKLSDFSRTDSEIDSNHINEGHADDLSAKLHVCIDELKRRKSVKERLHRVVDYLRDNSTNAHGNVVSQAEIAKELGIAKQTLSDDMKTIRDLASELMIRS